MNQARRKLLNAVLFFAQNTRNLNTTKLCKLLFFLDFTHVKETGFPVIGLQYHTFPKGPVPKNFWLEIKGGSPPADFLHALSIQTIQGGKEYGTEKEYRELRFIAKDSPDLRVFSPRERRIMMNLSEIYRDAAALQMSEITHLKNTPWDQTVQRDGLNRPIDYRLAIDEEALCSYQKADEQLKEFFAVNQNFTLSLERRHAQTR